MSIITWLQHGEDADTAHAFATTLLEAGFAEIESEGLCGRYPTAELRPETAGSARCPRCIHVVGRGGSQP